MEPCLPRPFGKQHGMCAESECVVIHGGQAENEGRGHCLSRGGGAGSLPLGCEEIWPEGLLPAPIGSHVTEESHLHINLPLYCSFLPPLHLSSLAQYAPASEWDKNKSHGYCLAVSLWLPSHSCNLVHILCCEGWRMFSDCAICRELRTFG